MDPRTAGTEALGGGCRAGFSGLVKALSKTGKFEVTAISTYRERRVEADDVLYVRLDEARMLPVPDIALAYYDVRVLNGLEADLRIASHHSLIPYYAWEYSDINTAPCPWAVEYLKRGYAPHGRWEVLPNAVEGLDGIDWKPVPGRVLYHTSPDRGLHLLLAAWPEIRRRVPNAELHVLGDPVGIATAKYPERSVLYRRSQAMARGLKAADEAGGLTLLGRLPRREVLREISEAACFPFPASVSVPCETFSVSILESMWVGVPVVLSPVDALESLWGDYVYSVPSPAELNMGPMVTGVVEMLTNPRHAQRISERQKAYARTFTFERKAAALAGMLERYVGDQ
jgi:glycosyltransferase involved in cell wall biosynthesis